MPPIFAIAPELAWAAIDQLGGVASPALPDAVAIDHNDEHLVLETEDAGTLRPGDPLLGIPHHICPTCALYREAVTVVDGCPSESWPTSARDRRLSI